MSAKLKLGSRVVVISSLGVAHQEPTDEVFVPAKLPNAIDEMPRQSYQWSEAVEVSLPWSLRARATGFTTFLQAGADHERSAGLELFIRRDFTKSLGGFISYTLSRTDETVNGQTFRASGDSTHLLSVVLGYDLGKNWRVGARFFLRSGRPYAVNCQTSDCSPGQSANVYTVRGELPPFYRIDGRIEKKWLFPRGKWLAATLECFNALDKGEVTNVTYSPQQGLAMNTQNPIILPSVGIEGGF